MAVPGPITSPTSVGSNRLIRDGAEPLLEVEDLLAHYPELARVTTPTAVTAPTALAASPAVVGRTPEETQLLETIGTGTHLDHIAATMAQPIGPLLAQLAQLELEGVVEQLPGRIFRVTGNHSLSSRA